MGMNDIEKQIADYYMTTLKSFGPGAKGVGWKSDETQAKRFLQLSRLIEENDNFSINDLGCGTGDLLPYLCNHGFSNFTYLGYDVLDAMLKVAIQQYGHIDQAHFVKVKGAGELKPADYTVASGIFNLKYSAGEKDWTRYITDTLEHMNNKSERGFGFNFLTKYQEKELMQGDFYYADPLFLFDHCKRKYSCNVALLHDYNEYDFTILVRK